MSASLTEAELIERLAYYYRLPRRRERHGRFCAEEGCANQLVRYATGGKRYCFEHGLGAARVRRHRGRRVDPS